MSKLIRVTKITIGQYNQLQEAGFVVAFAQVAHTAPYASYGYLNPIKLTKPIKYPSHLKVCTVQHVNDHGLS